MNGMRVLEFVKSLQRQGIKAKVAEQIAAFVEDRRGGLATKADLEQVERRLEAGIKGNRWAIGLLAGIMIGGFSLLLAVMLYLNNQANDRIDRIEAGIGKIETEIGKIEAELREIKELIIASRPTAQATGAQRR